MRDGKGQSKRSKKIIKVNQKPETRELFKKPLNWKPILLIAGSIFLILVVINLFGYKNSSIEKGIHYSRCQDCDYFISYVELIQSGEGHLLSFTINNTRKEIARCIVKITQERKEIKRLDIKNLEGSRNINLTLRVMPEGTTLFGIVPHCEYESDLKSQI